MQPLALLLLLLHTDPPPQAAVACRVEGLSVRLREGGTGRAEAEAHSEVLALMTSICRTNAVKRLSSRAALHCTQAHVAVLDFPRLGTESTPVNTRDHAGSAKWVADV